MTGSLTYAPPARMLPPALGMAAPDAYCGAPMSRFGPES